MFLKRILPKRLRHRNIPSTAVYAAPAPVFAELLEARQLLSGAVGTTAGHSLAIPAIVVPLTTNTAITTPAPVAVSPGSASAPYPVLTTTTPTFQWDAVTGVSGMTGYQINLYDQTAAKGTSYQVGVSATSFVLPSGVLVNGHTYVWNVRPVVGTQTGTESNYLYFQAPPAVTLPAPVATGQGSTTAPGPNLNTSEPTFQWNAVTGVSGLTGYQINLEDLTLKKGYSYQVGASVTSYTAPPSVLVPGDQFVWNVRILANGQSGPPSAYLYFQIPPAVTLPAPVAVTPGSTTAPGPVLTTNTPTLQWDAVTGVSNLSGYQINLYDQTAAKGYSYKVGASATSFTVPAGVVVNGDKFVWNVRALAGTQSGPPSAYLYFQAPAPVILPAPTPLGPGSTLAPGLIITTLTPTFNWTAVTGVSGMTGYQINLYNQTTAKGVSYTVGASDTSFTLPSGVLVPGDKYVWNVRILVGSQSGPPSAYDYFQTQSTSATQNSKITAQIQAATQELSRLGVKQRATQRDMAATDITKAAYDALLQNLNVIEKQTRVVRRELKVLESEA